MKLFLSPFLFLLAIVFYCCSPVKEEGRESASNDSDTTLMAKQWLYGLWSEDSGNILSNTGFYFSNDGTMQMTSAEYEGEWSLVGLDSIKIKINGLNRIYETDFRIDSLSDNRMVLRDSEKVRIYRKVPFGFNTEGHVLQGYTGYIDAGTTKDYYFDMPPAKKVMLKMYCPDSSVTFRLYDDLKKEITSTDVRNWAGIVIRSGKYKITLSKPKDSKWKEESDYDIKVLAY